MIEKNVYCELIKKGEFSKIIPKIFLQNDGSCIKSSGLFRSGITGREKELEDRLSKFSLSERFFYQLKSGLEQGEKIYNERRLKIEMSEHAETLKTSLLLIFEHENFKSATVKTPELYFATYKAIINSKIINNEDLNLDTVISLVTSRTGNNEYRQVKIQNILHSHNLEHHDLVYIYFYLQSGSLFEMMRVFIDKNNSLSNWLFQTNLTSQLVDYVFELESQKSYDLVHQTIFHKLTSGMHYISNWEFENGVELLAWFKAVMYYYVDEALPGNYVKKGAFGRFSSSKEKFVSYNVSLSKILDMFPDIKARQISANTTEKCSSVLNEEKQKTLTKISPHDSSFVSDSPHLETSTEKSRATVSSSKKFSKINISSSLKKNEVSSKRKFLGSNVSESEKKPKSEMEEAQVFSDYSKIFLQANINPVLESPQVFNRDYAPISNFCLNLMTGKNTIVHPPRQVRITKPVGAYSIHKPGVSFFKANESTPINLILSKQSRLEKDCIIALIDLSSKSKFN